MKVLTKLICFLLALLIAIAPATLAGTRSQAHLLPNNSTIIALTGIPTVSVNKLPPEAKQTIQLIRQGGPFPYSKDGTVFSNRERILPKAPQGYYREYTVPTPGISGRGARRLVVGKGDEIYYTGDHYKSFVRVRF